MPRETTIRRYALGTARSTKEPLATGSPYASGEWIGGVCNVVSFVFRGAYRYSVNLSPKDARDVAAWIAFMLTKEDMKPGVQDAVKDLRALADWIEREQAGLPQPISSEPRRS